MGKNSLHIFRKHVLTDRYFPYVDLIFARSYKELPLFYKCERLQKLNEAACIEYLLLYNKSLSHVALRITNVCCLTVSGGQKLGKGLAGSWPTGSQQPVGRGCSHLRGWPGLENPLCGWQNNGLKVAHRPHPEPWGLAVG